MCYTGKCKYEIIGGDFWGDCSLPRKNYLGERFPEDTLCVQIETEIEEAEREEALGELDGFDPETAIIAERLRAAIEAMKEKPCA